jgi:hypothetical protein
MSEFRELSKLPDDPEYWAALEKRVLAGLPAEPHAVAPPGGPGRNAVGWWSAFETGAPALLATALAAVLAALLLLPPRPATEGGELLLTPADPAGASIIAAPSPPALASLVFPADGKAVR